MSKKKISSKKTTTKKVSTSKKVVVKKVAPKKVKAPVKTKVEKVLSELKPGDELTKEQQEIVQEKMAEIAGKTNKTKNIEMLKELYKGEEEEFLKDLDFLNGKQKEVAIKNRMKQIKTPEESKEFLKVLLATADALEKERKPQEEITDNLKKLVDNIKEKLKEVPLGTPLKIEEKQNTETKYITPDFVKEFQNSQDLLSKFDNILADSKLEYLKNKKQTETLELNNILDEEFKESFKKYLSSKRKFNIFTKIYDQALNEFINTNVPQVSPEDLEKIANNFVCMDNLFDNLFLYTAYKTGDDYVTKLEEELDNMGNIINKKGIIKRVNFNAK
jgi:hypothetical protein